MPDGAAIVAITLKQELVLVKQYKHGLGQIVLELPAGNVESNEDPWHTIARELVEETGYEASSVELISILATKPARMSARTFIYFARDVKFTGRQQNDDAEVIEVVLIPLKDIPTLLREGKIITETSLAAIMMAWDRLIPLL
jgi:8-oxo-dGTP pyrophosphatase MutT (NUDIX family)